MKSKILAKQRGFTLIELLIVIVIIGLLTSFLTANFIGARQRARDGKRKSDLQQIRSALELYRADVGSYPTAAACLDPGVIKAPNGGTVYMQTVPCDPKDGSAYTYTSDGSTYTIYACLENGSDHDRDSSNSCSSSPGRVSYTLKNP